VIEFHREGKSLNGQSVLKARRDPSDSLAELYPLVFSHVFTPKSAAACGRHAQAQFTAVTV
jgi:hypothetical protein